MSNAFSNALALESVGELGIFNAATGTYSGVTHDDLVRYARTVAYKVFHNLKLGHTMSKEDDPLTVDGVSAANVWADHYEFVSENPLCGEWYRVPYPPTDAMKDAWNNDDSNDFNTAYLAMVHASPAAAQFCGKCDKPDDDGPGEEDGPWAKGWEQRSCLPSQNRINKERLTEISKQRDCSSERRNKVTPLPPQDIQISAVKIGEWFIENNLTDWKIGHCASRETVEKLEKQCDELLAALQSISKITGDAGFNIGGPLEH